MEPTEVVRELFERANRRDYSGADRLYSDDVELVMPDSVMFINSGVFAGRAAVGRWFLDWFRTFSDAPQFDVREAEDAGGGIVAVSAHSVARGSASGIEVEADYFYAITVRDGKICRFEFHHDRASARAAAGLPA